MYFPGPFVVTNTQMRFDYGINEDADSINNKVYQYAKSRGQVKVLRGF